jgi:hypothetical protein
VTFILSNGDTFSVRVDEEEDILNSADDLNGTIKLELGMQLDPEFFLNGSNITLTNGQEVKLGHGNLGGDDSYSISYDNGNYKEWIVQCNEVYTVNVVRAETPNDQASTNTINAMLRSFTLTSGSESSAPGFFGCSGTG